MRDRRRSIAVIIGMIAILGATCALALARSPILGLDLQGGLEVILQAQPPKGHKVTSADIARSVEIMRSRVDKLGVAEPDIRSQSGNQISIQLPGVHNSAQAAAIIGETAQLQFYDLEGDVVGISRDTNGQPVAETNVKKLLVNDTKLKNEGRQWYIFRGNKKLAGPDASQAAALTELGRKKLPAGDSFWGVPTNRIILTCTTEDVYCPGVGVPKATYYYLYKYHPAGTHPIPEMTGSDLKLSGTRQDFDTQTNEPIVTLQFTNKGGAVFHNITRTLAQRGQQMTAQYGTQGGTPILQHFAIVLDGDIKSWPSIDYTQYPDGISGTAAEINGMKNIQAAKNLALVLQTGALPMEFKQVSRTDVSATLGADSLHQALIAGIGGLIAVAIFLLLLYRFLGLIAIIGLGFYGVLLYAAILGLNVTLTLPGFAGLVLTIGVAADANVVIFERIKEEARSGKSIRAAIATGYEKGFHTIIDANVVTLITAFVLFAVATAGVKGFALMLILGTILSMITAIAATRALLNLLANFRWFDNPRFMGAGATRESRWTHVDFVGHWKIWFALSGAILAIGVGSLAAQGLNLGIDFRGGSQVTFDTASPTSLDTVRTEASKLGQGKAIIQGTGHKTATGDYRSFQIQMRSLSGDAQNKFQQALRTDLRTTSVSVKNVSPSFSNQILKGALYAIVAGLTLIFLYIIIRFQWQFAIPVLVSLLHDLLLTIGVYSLSQREVTTSTVAAVLTILGYTIYDTIIVFDRVRENIPLLRRVPFADIANRSLWETIRRSMATTFITLLPVTALLIFGGSTLKDFAFALAIGITSGAYSTIFIATPLLNLIKRREPEYAGRTGKHSGDVTKTEAYKLKPVNVPKVTALAPISGEDREKAAARRKARAARRRHKHGRR